MNNNKRKVDKNKLLLCFQQYLYNSNQYLRPIVLEFL